MKEIHYLTALNDPEQNQKMISKLPENICDQWGRKVDHWLNMKGQELQEPTSTKSPYPRFSAFCDFLKCKARIACNPVTMGRAEEREGIRLDIASIPKNPRRKATAKLMLNR